jgi:uncharacterized RDD family membrane protein YckC
MAPDANPPEVHYVGFWARFLAFLVDSLLAMLLLSPIAAFFFGDDSPGTQLLQESPEALLEAMTSPSQLFSWLLTAAAIVIFWIYRSATPGKMLIGAVIVDAETLGRPSTAQLVGRYFAYYVSMLLFGMGFGWIAFDRRKQGWHDKLAGTVVIKAQKTGDKT